MKFRLKQQAEIEAMQYTRNGLEAEKVADWCNGNQMNEGCEIETVGGNSLAHYGDWIIKGADGQFYTCSNDNFNYLYKPI